MCQYELSMSKPSKVIVWQINRQTDRQTRPKLYTTPPCGWLNNKTTRISINIAAQHSHDKIIFTRRDELCTTFHQNGRSFIEDIAEASLSLFSGHNVYECI